MKWDEDRFGLEYDLDIYNIVAVKAGSQRVRDCFLEALHRRTLTWELWRTRA